MLCTGFGIGTGIGIGITQHLFISQHHYTTSFFSLHNVLFSITKHLFHFISCCVVQICTELSCHFVTHLISHK